MKTWDQFYIEYMIKRSKPYYKSPGWALQYNPWLLNYTVIIQERIFIDDFLEIDEQIRLI
ncbi:hypothetical protein D5055_08215 [Acinetobacter radioresistens]|nr:hypothetical protein D5055_08215 [Acinetobacter radioresistens]